MMNKKKSFRYDGIKNDLLKSCSPIKENILFAELNERLDAGKRWKFLRFAKNVSKFKQCERNGVEICQPSSLLCPISKNDDTHIYIRIVIFFKISKFFLPYNLHLGTNVHVCMLAVVSKI